ncbi:hypothetical protein Q765_07005 [Flavobacterium rivuli WB 3.3-2 = DSM 21788]|uniref:Uncharacterized protein n=1 Tax=Flavobacterium rivuli WB 3.3-2 = DSM 21788 TaxID=1121895 RepID=A0A0A2M423_9FLAO|nr:hypothetical protein [Flavobacterium rivuli]KGO87407.1 hypothetical protein Q765_07005 [Flavobacterium rivuli WB 3.3-2 = DSM 21788]
MKKVFLTLGAILVFGMAQAQTQPTTTPKKEPVTTQVKEKSKKEAEGVQPAVQVNTAEPLSKDAVAPEDGVTADHVKVSPKTKITKDSTAVKKVKSSKKS